MKEVQINIKLGDNSFSSAINTRGFDNAQGMKNAIEIISLLELVKQQEINKFNKNMEDE